MSSTQISAHISKETKSQLESYVKRHGVKKAFLVEEALLHHLQALREVPEDIVVPTRLVLTEESMKQLADLLETKKQAPQALKALFND